MLAQMQLEKSRLQSLVVRFNDEWLVDPPAEQEERYDYRPTLDIGRAAEDSRRFLVSLAVALGPCQDQANACRFSSLEVALQGIFVADDELEEEEQINLVANNAAAILHGIARGLVIGATGACVGGPFMLPTVSPMALIEEMNQRYASQEAAAEATEQG